MSTLSSLRPEALDAPPSGIVEVMRHGFGRPGLIPLWAGEGDLPTPAFIGAEAARAIAAGETFYTWQRGIPELRDALARYHGRLFGGSFSPERFFVTGSGMHAIGIAARLLTGPGDEVVLPTPAWPNLAAAVGLVGARPVAVPQRFGNAGWAVDLDALFAAVTPRTRAIFVNSPSNPTGWTATRDELAAILAFARQRGVWIIADEVYCRFVFDGARAPSFHDVAEPEDRVLFVNTFSKNWAMTGWRVGWIEAPPELGETIENLVQYSNSGVAQFMQRAAVVALDEGDDFIALQVERARIGREVVADGFRAAPRIRFAEPAGAFYQFFAIDGEDDVRGLGLRLVDEANVGIAPGTAFGPGGDGYLRLCFARGAESLTEAVARIVAWTERARA